jgi:hypothetical protein
MVVSVSEEGIASPGARCPTRRSRLTSYTNVICFNEVNRGGTCRRLEEPGELFERGPGRLQVTEGKGDLRELIFHT